MKIAGFLKNSFVDYPGKISAVIFTQGCNMKCSFCHNSQLIPVEAEEELMNVNNIIEFLKNRREFLDGVVITGGEPTLWPEIKSLIKRIKELGFCVKLDTNGTNPKLLKELINENLIDYVAMDIKGPMEKYSQICCAKINLEDVKESIDFLLEEKVDYEFRTTFAPELNQEDLLKITEFITGARKYVLQQYKEIEKETGVYTGISKKRDILEDVYNSIDGSVKKLQVRGEIALI